MSELRRQRGLLDTSVVIALPHVDRSRLPVEMAMSAITLAELVTGPHATTTLKSEPDDRISCRGPRGPSIQRRSMVDGRWTS